MFVGARRGLFIYTSRKTAEWWTGRAAIQNRTTTGIDFAVFPFRLFRPYDAKRMAITTGNALATCASDAPKNGRGSAGSGPDRRDEAGREATVSEERRMYEVNRVPCPWVGTGTATWPTAGALPLNGSTWRNLDRHRGLS